jgi:hypothetical protein
MLHLFNVCRRDNHCPLRTAHWAKMLCYVMLHLFRVILL